MASFLFGLHWHGEWDEHCPCVGCKYLTQASYPCKRLSSDSLMMP